MAKEKYFPIFFDGVAQSGGGTSWWTAWLTKCLELRRQLGAKLGGPRMRQQMKERESISGLDTRRTGRDHEVKTS
jgi:hypothetical protein